MVVNLEGSPEVNVNFPEGEWLAPDPSAETEGTYLKYPSESMKQDIFNETRSFSIFYIPITLVRLIMTGNVVAGKINGGISEKPPNLTRHN